ncbi:Protein TIC 214 [Frankliniella fusca]|uniref:Protein TIC 214 n=1 Tax=Frankliniella fusca TaxID=407009 RepID=A0AAE1LHK5_9NEOP|nr:Protein TIC 214 [Frankliniella fusca]
MANLFKRVASVVMKDESSEVVQSPSFKKSKAADMHEEKTGASEVDNIDRVRPVGNANEGCHGIHVPSQEERNGNNDKEEDDDLFGDLNEPTERIIQKVSEMKVGEIYQLVDIYSIQVEDRLAIVGGFQLENEGIMYVWLPSSLVKNYDAKKVVELKDKISKGKKGYAVFNGMKTTKYDLNNRRCDTTGDDIC